MAKKKKQRNEGEIATMIDAAIDKGQDLTGLIYEIETEYESPGEVAIRKAKEKAEQAKAKEKAEQAKAKK